MEERSETTDFAQRLYEAFGTTNRSEISRRSGVSNAALMNYAKGIRLPESDNLIKLGRASGVSIHWLLTGEGTKVPDGACESGVSLVYFGAYETEVIRDLAATEQRAFDDEVRELVLESLQRRGLVAERLEENLSLVHLTEPLPDLIEIPLVGAISAGRPLVIFEDPDSVMVPGMFRQGNREVFALRVAGDSMEDEGILSGDLIICYKTSSAHNGQNVVALIDGAESTVKKFFLEGNRVRLQPANRRYPPLILDASRVEIQAIVTGVYRPV